MHRPLFGSFALKFPAWGAERGYQSCVRGTYCCSTKGGYTRRVLDSGIEITAKVNRGAGAVMATCGRDHCQSEQKGWCCHGDVRVLEITAKVNRGAGAVMRRVLEITAKVNRRAGAVMRRVPEITATVDRGAGTQSWRRPMHENAMHNILI